MFRDGYLDIDIPPINEKFLQKYNLTIDRLTSLTVGGVRRGSGWKTDSQKLGPRAAMVRADLYAKDLRDVLKDIGPSSLRQIAAELKARNIRTPRGGEWTATSVKRLQHRLEKLPQLKTRVQDSISADQ